MKHFKRSHFALIPLLSILAMSPAVLQSKYEQGRSIASVLEDSKHPKYDSMVSKIDAKALMKDMNLDAEKLKAKLKEIGDKSVKVKADFKKDQSDKQVVADQRKVVEELVKDVVLLDGGLQDLKEKKLVSEEDEKGILPVIEALKLDSESLIVDLEANEVLVAKADEPKKEEPKKEEPKKEDKPVIAEEPKKEEPKKEEPKKDEPKKEEVAECKDEKHKVLSAQVEQLMQQQNLIMQNLLGMSQAMITMMQQQQNMYMNPYYSGGGRIQPYQYNAPMTAGNWVYYPQGFQPQQSNIFMGGTQGSGIYPDSMQGWNMQPTFNIYGGNGNTFNGNMGAPMGGMGMGQQQVPSFGQGYGQAPQMSAQPMFTPGTFGGGTMSYNMQNSVPTVTMK